MNKLFSTVCITLCLFFSAATTAVQADGNGHAPGYVCVETTTVAVCPPKDAPPQPSQSETSGSINEEAADTASILLELIITLLP